MNARLAHLALAAMALLVGGALCLGALIEEAALSALFALACLHQACHAGDDPRLHKADQLLFLILRHLDDLRRRTS